MEGEEEARERLARLPGFGARTLDRAVAELGSAQTVLEALQTGDTTTLSRISGIGERTARRLVHAVQGTQAMQFFGTPRAARLWEAFQKDLVARACTRAGANRLRLLTPHPDRAERERRLAWCKEAAHETSSFNLQETRALLRRIHPLLDSKPAFEADVLLMFDDPDALHAARQAGLHEWASLTHLRQGDLRERMDEADLVVHTTDHASDRPHRLEEAGHLLTIPHSLDPARLAPWGTIRRYEQARDTLEAAAALSHLRGNESASETALRWLDERKPAPEPRTPGDVEARAQVLLEEELEEAEGELSRLTLTGSEFMRALKEDLPPGVTQLFAEAARRANDRLEQETGLTLDAYTDTSPPRVDAAVIRNVVHQAARTHARDRLQHDHTLATRLVELEPNVVGEIADHEAFDARQAIGSLWNEHGFTEGEEGEGLLVEGLRPLHIHTEMEGVDYRLGVGSDGAPEATTVALLTGANSGGKTTLLESIALLVSLAHAGLGVPARRAIVPELDAVHLYAPSRDRSAGALETLLVELFPLIDQDGRRLVLADELEAITELEAASEILAAWIEGLVAKRHLAVLATHLAPYLVGALEQPVRDRVRIDGIEAHGLDPQGRLQVERSPRLDHLARSTPELILRRLAEHGPPALTGRFQRLAERVQVRLASKAPSETGHDGT